MNDDVTRILDAIERGDRQAASQLLPLVYDELRRLAGVRMKQERASHTLDPTALVHEAYMRLVGSEDANRWDNRGHFFAAAAEAMRRILVESARHRNRLKRGGGWKRVELDDRAIQVEGADDATLIALDEALTRLEQQDPKLAELVKLRYFAGMTVNQTAEVLGVSPRTVKRNWAFARAWLMREIDGPTPLDNPLKQSRRGEDESNQA